jgi:dTDP-4-dehydrorhamnose reductase
MKIIVLGGVGQLGQCLQAVAKRKGIDNILFLDEHAGNILDKAILGTLFAQEKPTHVINCAAYTAVDKAEDEVELSDKINCVGAVNIAEACLAHDCELIHISTDFVFEGNVPQLLTETDVAAPINVYGKTKLAGEVGIEAVLPQHYILRTSWLYSEFANNFVKTMLRLGKERESLGVIVDQMGSPTYAIDLAAVIFELIMSDKKAYGIYHYSNEGATSWYDFAQAIFELSGVSVKVNPVKTTEYITKAVRPAFSVMDKTKIKTTFGIEIPYWRDSLKVCLAAIAK